MPTRESEFLRRVSLEPAKSTLRVHMLLQSGAPTTLSPGISVAVFTGDEIIRTSLHKHQNQPVCQPRAREQTEGAERRSIIQNSLKRNSIAS